MEWQWVAARASGFTAYILVTLAVVFGLLLSQRWQSRRSWPRLLNDQMHQYLTLVAGIFTAVHGVSVLIDPFTAFSLREVLLPFASHYRPVWMALGIIAAYLGLAVVVTGWLRPKIGYAWWRRLHYLTFAVWLLATLHGLGNGSDTRTAWALGIYGASTAAVGGLTVVRLLWPAGRPRVAARPAWAALAAALALAVAAFTAVGPARSGWNKIANNGQGSGGRSGPTAVTVSTLAPYTATFAGTVRQSAPDAQGATTLTFALRVQGGPYGRLGIVLNGQSLASGGVALTSSDVTLGTAQDPGLFRGAVTGLSGGSFTAEVQGPSGALSLVGALSLAGAQSVQGSLQVQGGGFGGAQGGGGFGGGSGGDDGAGGSGF